MGDSEMKYTVDIQSTATYSDQYNEPCNCIYCQNYEKTFTSSYPEVIKILHEFGVPVERPIEIMDFFWNDAKDKRQYESYYSVKGELFEDQLVVYNKDAIITLYRPDTSVPIYGNTGMEEPYFILVVSNIELPWVLSETPDD
jgi:hypothetical protein